MITNYKHKMFEDMQQYRAICNLAHTSPEMFWKNIASMHLTWIVPPTEILPDIDCLETGDIEWFRDGVLNASFECLDTHIQAGNADRVAYIVEPNDPADEVKEYTYFDLYCEVNKLTNTLISHNIKKGDRVCIYLQMGIQLPISMLACARIGAIHAVVFGGFSPQSLASRIDDLECNAVITQDTAHRGKKKDIPMKAAVDDALKICKTKVEKVFIHKNTGTDIVFNKRDVYLEEEDQTDSGSPYEKMNAEDPLFVLYTSGSTGKPKGVLHTTGGYLVNAAFTHRMIYDCAPDDIQWICADIGWSTGHTYCVYAPLINQVKSIIFEGSITYPDHSRVWDIIEKHKATVFQIPPTGLRMLLKYGDKSLEGKNLDSLKVVGSVGEPIKEPEWKWLYEKIGQEKCPVLDTWWQTETGACQLTPIPGITQMKPGSLGYCMPGCDLVLLEKDDNDDYVELNDLNSSGSLYIKVAPPSIMRTVYGDHKRFLDTYITNNKGYFFTGDRAKIDETGMFSVSGREDDTIQVSGILIGTAEVEGCIQQVENITEAAVVGYPDEITGESVAAFIVMSVDATEMDNDNCLIQIRKHVSETITTFASPTHVYIVKELPKTRSGKIMRRVLRQIVKESRATGDMSTLVNPDCVSDILEIVTAPNS